MSDEIDLKFSDAMDELEEILRRIEDDEVELDELADEVARASELISACRSKIERTEEEVKSILAGLDSEDA